MYFIRTLPEEDRWPGRWPLAAGRWPLAAEW